MILVRHDDECDVALEFADCGAEVVLEHHDADVVGQTFVDLKYYVI